MTQDALSSYDQINSAFVLTAAFFYVLNLFKLIKDKEVKGISKISIGFFSLWNVWTLFFFIKISEYWWTIGAYVLVAILNVIYITLMIKYNNKND
jgi:FtsH-binding integral membrane protein|tara:strand:+ start:1493 stop:1777 length:285 start_codon:yes stop_codon:yes gene_type:complete